MGREEVGEKVTNTCTVVCVSPHTCTCTHKLVYKAIQQHWSKIHIENKYSNVQCTSDKLYMNVQLIINFQHSDYQYHERRI